MEDIMKTIIQISTTALLLASIFSQCAPAIAVEAGEALKICRAHPKTCHVDGVNPSGDLVMDSGSKVVLCPVRVPCTIQRTSGFNHIGEGGNAQVHENGDTVGGTDGGGTIY